MFYDKPHLASRYYGKLLSSIDGIFSDDHQLLPYYTCAFTLYRLEYLFRNKTLPSQYRKFKYYILMMLKYSLAEEVNKITPLLDKYVDDITSNESTKSASLVESLKSEFHARR